VGPPRVEPRRLTAAYTLVQDGKEETTELVYRFEEDVFTPGEPASMNLASMIAAQVALNYGLFSEVIVFHGWFDRHDRQFLEEMAENTAREIYVKKFLEPNPFLQGPASEIGLVRKEKYLQSRILFSDERAPDGSANWKAELKRTVWKTESRRHAVLSSGGKDSLLSFALLRDIGREVHPVFINESGRHWFTALNAYRHFADNFPHTSRVWTNSDRLFNWMLRHLPFVRKDFSAVRSDEYPIRLWTVAVFLFGALPMLKKRGIGRLIIGDEYDSTNRTSRQKIPHYDGLFDQSRFFDNALTRYFRKKRWGLSQFSILRPLSELLIQKILVKRYPDLQTHQVSCHATHKEGDRILPCGRCEKCRRIVGMLVALGVNPSRCGYKPEEIDGIIDQLRRKGIHQESEGAQHLGHLLRKKKVIDSATLGKLRIRERPEIAKLRFDAERSPLDGIPVDLREDLYRIYLDHADGALRRSGRVWIEFDPLLDPSLARPYRFEKALPNKEGRKPGGNSDTRFALGLMTWQEAERKLEDVDIALLPVGSIEQHGPHLPLDTDAFDAEYLALEVAKACQSPRPVVFPLIPYGVSYHHSDFGGTLSVSPETLSRLVYEIGMSAAQQGILKLLIINGHGGNGPALHFAAQMINRDAHIFTCVDTGESSDTDIEGLVETPNDVHAGEIETSTALATRPDLVNLKAAERFVPRFSSRYMNFSSKRSVGWYAHVARISSNGVLGDPTCASRDKGKKIWEVMIKNLVEFVEDLKDMSLDEIYQKRY
jgi:creatinine amidohydrolase/Fe(II)-dependent formamide hydrolase-like protein/7-cyano-7-deazaguanine synthase in queuosine biosynthesis